MAEEWEITKERKRTPSLKNPVLIEGMPGIGNVGKIAIDFMIEEIGAKKLYSLFSYSFPHSAFVNEDNLVELPTIEVYYKKFRSKKKQDLLILTGDVQPTDEASSYAFCEEIIKLAKEHDVTEIVTTGGIGLKETPDDPQLFITGNSKKAVKKYSKGTELETDIHGVVGPIVGVSGLLVGLGEKRDMDAVAVLSETFAHPMYLGVKGAKKMLKLFDDKYNLKLKLDKLDKEIKKLEKNTIKKTKDLSTAKAVKEGHTPETSYIG